MGQATPEEIAYGIRTAQMGPLVDAFIQNKEESTRETILGGLTLHVDEFVAYLWEIWDDVLQAIEKGESVPLLVSLRYDRAKIVALAIGEPIVEPLLTSVRLHEHDTPIHVLEVLQGLPSISGRMSRALEDEDSTVRFLAADYFVFNANPLGVPALCEALADVHPRVRSTAATALGRIGAPESADALMACLGDEDGDVREAAARSLGDLGATKAAELLAAQLQHDPSGSARFGAAQALHALQLPEYTDVLRSALEDPHRSVRRVAIEALVGLKDVAIMDALKRMKKKDPDGYVRVEAGKALKELKRLDK